MTSCAVWPRDQPMCPWGECHSAALGRVFGRCLLGLVGGSVAQLLLLDSGLPGYSVPYRK